MKTCKVAGCRNEANNWQGDICFYHWGKLPWNYRRELYAAEQASKDAYRGAFNAAISNLEMREQAETAGIELGIPANRIGYASGRIRPEKILAMRPETYQLSRG
jgi:hypothetical protein